MARRTGETLETLAATRLRATATAAALAALAGALVFVALCAARAGLDAVFGAPIAGGAGDYLGLRLTAAGAAALSGGAAFLAATAFRGGLELWREAVEARAGDDAAGALRARLRPSAGGEAIGASEASILALYSAGRAAGERWSAPLAAAATASAALLFLVLIDWALAVAAAAALTVEAALRARVARAPKAAEAVARADASAALAAWRAGADELEGEGPERWSAAQLRARLGARDAAAAADARRTAWRDAVGDGAAQWAAALFAALATLAVAAGAASFGALAASFLALREAAAAAERWRAWRSRAAAARATLAELAPQLSEPDLRVLDGRARPAGALSLRLEGWRVAGGPAITAEIAPGEVARLVSAGPERRRAAAAALVGLGRASEGAALFGGAPLDAMGLRRRAADLAYISKPATLFDGSVRANLALTALRRPARNVDGAPPRDEDWIDQAALGLTATRPGEPGAPPADDPLRAVDRRLLDLADRLELGDVVFACGLDQTMPRDETARRDAALSDLRRRLRALAPTLEGAPIEPWALDRINPHASLLDNLTLGAAPAPASAADARREDRRPPERVVADILAGKPALAALVELGADLVERLAPIAEAHRDAPILLETTPTLARGDLDALRAAAARCRAGRARAAEDRALLAVALDFTPAAHRCADLFGDARAQAVLSARPLFHRPTDKETGLARWRFDRPLIDNLLDGRMRLDRRSRRMAAVRAIRAEAEATGLAEAIGRLGLAAPALSAREAGEGALWGRAARLRLAALRGVAKRPRLIVLDGVADGDDAADAAFRRALRALRGDATLVYTARSAQRRSAPAAAALDATPALARAAAETRALTALAAEIRAGDDRIVNLDSGATYGAAEIAARAAAAEAALRAAAAPATAPKREAEADRAPEPSAVAAPPAPPVARPALPTLTAEAAKVAASAVGTLAAYGKQAAARADVLARDGAKRLSGAALSSWRALFRRLARPADAAAPNPSAPNSRAPNPSAPNPRAPSATAPMSWAPKPPSSTPTAAAPSRTAKSAVDAPITLAQDQETPPCRLIDETQPTVSTAAPLFHPTAQRGARSATSTPSQASRISATFRE